MWLRGRSATVQKAVRSCTRVKYSGKALDTLLAHAGGSCKATGAITPPLHLATTFERTQEDLSYSRGFDYSRSGNPTRELLEQTFAEIEGGSHAAAFSSGMAAATAVLLAMPQCFVVLPDDLYHGVHEVMDSTLAPWGARWVKVDMTNEQKVEKALRMANESAVQHVVFWLESPSNPSIKICDIQQLNTMAKGIVSKDRLLTVVDSTWTTPVITRPLTLGADVVLHSMTKYIGGHSDVLAGIVIVGDTIAGAKMFPKLKTVQTIGGAVCSPFDSWLAMRGLRTLGVRMARHSSSAMQVAEAISAHPGVEAVLYPGLPSHPQYSIAKKQMHMFGGMMSLLIRGGQEEAVNVVRHLKLLKKATSLGGTESLIEHRRSTEPSWSSTPLNLLRLSVGLEDPVDLIQDLQQAITMATGSKPL